MVLNALLHCFVQRGAAFAFKSADGYSGGNGMGKILFVGNYQAPAVFRMVGIRFL